MTTLHDRQRAMILGAFTADAATMGLHWLYDQPRIKDVAPSQPEFHTPNPADYEGVPGYFAHPTRAPGDQSHYGEQALTMLRAIQSNGAYSRETYQQAFRDHFGYGGTFVGYIDRATRDTLNKLATMEDTAQGYPGSQDTQLPAVSKLPALVARHHSDALSDMVEDAVRVTNNNDLSVRYAQTSAQLLADILRTGTLPDLTALANGAEEDVADPITTALNDPDSTEDVTAKIGLSCYLNYGVPSVFHNLSTATSFTDAIRTNIYAGGDNCGRAVLLGAAMGALHGVGGATGIPQTWIDKLSRKQELETFADSLA